MLLYPTILNAQDRLVKVKVKLSLYTLLRHTDRAEAKLHSFKISEHEMEVSSWPHTLRKESLVPTEYEAGCLEKRNTPYSYQDMNPGS
jgi:hypothetical protein